MVQRRGPVSKAIRSCSRMATTSLMVQRLRRARTESGVFPSSSSSDTNHALPLRLLELACFSALTPMGFTKLTGFWRVVIKARLKVHRTCAVVRISNRLQFHFDDASHALTNRQAHPRLILMDLEGTMTSDMTLRVLEKEVLELPPRSRARLAERIIESIDDYADPRLEAEWDAEIERRVREIESGAEKGIPA